MNGWWTTLAGYGRKEPAGFAAILLLTLAGVGLAALAPWPLKIIVDYLLRNEPVPEQLDWLGFLFAMPVTSSLIVLVGATLIVFASTQAIRVNGGLRLHITVKNTTRVTIAVNKGIATPSMRSRTHWVSEVILRTRSPVR